MSEEREFERRILWRPAFDKRSDEPSKDYGVGAMLIHWVLVGPLGTVNFVMSTGWYLPQVIEWWKRRGIYNPEKDKPEAFSLSYHSPTPQREGQHKAVCDLLEDGFCYGDTTFSSTDEWPQLLIAEGDEAIWSRLEEFYRETLEAEPVEATASPRTRTEAEGER